MNYYDYMKIPLYIFENFWVVKNEGKVNSKFCPGEMEAPKALPCLAFILRFLFFYPLCVRSKSDHSFFQGPLLSKARRGAHRHHTEFKIYFHGNLSTLHFFLIILLMLYFPVRSTWDWTYLSISTYGGVQALLPCMERFCMNILWPSILSIIFSLLKFLIDNKEK